MNNTTIEAIITALVAAGSAIKEVYQQDDINISYKHDASPVTKADLTSQAIILSALQEITADIPVISEESADLNHANTKDYGKFWLLDPLDGTKAFIEKKGRFCISLGLIEDGKPTVGFLYDPIYPMLAYTSGKGWKLELFANKIAEGKFEAEKKLYSRYEKPVQLGSQHHANHHADNADDNDNDNADDAVQTNTIAMSSAVKFIYLALGYAQVYHRHGPTMLWDTAAGQAILNQAGGKVVNMADQSELTYQPNKLTNPHFSAFASTDD